MGGGDRGWLGIWTARTGHERSTKGECDSVLGTMSGKQGRHSNSACWFNEVISMRILGITAFECWGRDWAGHGPAPAFQNQIQDQGCWVMARG